jgi:hypothetical protein
MKRRTERRTAAFVGICVLALAASGIFYFSRPEVANGLTAATYVLPNPRAHCRLHYRKKITRVVEFKRITVDGKTVARRVHALRGECHYDPPETVTATPPSSPSTSRITDAVNTRPAAPTTTSPSRTTPTTTTSPSRTTPTTTTTAPPATTTTTTTVPSGNGFDPQQTSQWAGYFETPGAVRSVSATWVVPALVCSGTETLSSTWVGIGGLSGGALLQAGMYDNCIGGVSENGAFAEEYPGSTASFDLLISPGDTVTATVSDAASGWQAEVTDVTTGQTASASAPDYSGGGSAEWMVEAYGAPGGIAVSDFGTEQLSAFTVGGAPASIPGSDVWEMASVTASDPATGVYRLTYG